MTQSTQYIYGPQNKTFTFGYQYDNLNRLTKVMYPGDYEVSYSYNQYSYLSQVNDSTFNCTVNHLQEWQPIAEKIVNSLEVLK